MPGEQLTIADQSITSRKVDLTNDQQEVATSQTTTSTSFTDLATVGPAVTLTPNVTQDHIIWFSAQMSNNTAGTNSAVSLSVAGAAALVGIATRSEMTANATNTCSRAYRAAAQTSGAVHTTRYNVGSGTGSFFVRISTGLAI